MELIQVLKQEESKIQIERTGYKKESKIHRKIILLQNSQRDSSTYYSLYSSNSLEDRCPLFTPTLFTTHTYSMVSYPISSRVITYFCPLKHFGRIPILFVVMILMSYMIVSFAGLFISSFRSFPFATCSRHHKHAHRKFMRDDKKDMNNYSDILL